VLTPEQPGHCSWALTGPPPELNDRSNLTPPASQKAAYRAGSGGMWSRRLAWEGSLAVCEQLRAAL